MKRILSIILTFAMMMTFVVPAFATEGKEEGDVSVELAYMDLDQASAETQEKIIKAREEIIFSQSWVADGLQGFVHDENGNIIEELPQFSEIFPNDWTVPVLEAAPNGDLRNIGVSQSLEKISDAFLTLFSDTLELKVPSNYYNSPSFTSFDTTFWRGFYYYDVKYVRTQAYDKESDATYRNYFNVGYTNAVTGASLGWLTEIESGNSFGITTKSNTEIAVRASMYSDNSAITSGEWDVTVFADCDILND